MAMTERERLGREIIMKSLRKHGYVTYSNLLSDFHLNFTNDPRVLGYMEPKKGRIVVNSSLDMDQVEVIIRHEILHFYLKHAQRTLRKLAQLKGLDPDSIDDMTVKELEREIYGDPDQLANWAADFDISNQGYTDKDKAIIRSLHALVTEDHYSDWTDLTMEEMYERLLKERENKQKIVYGAFMDSTTFIGADPRTGQVTMYGR
ncbi:MAG: hypothetical protein IJH65_04065 [Methanobrevibacter sp.]|nr:hypothetical protein [Methanobrevibacter sp.]